MNDPEPIAADGKTGDPPWDDRKSHVDTRGSTSPLIGLGLTTTVFLVAGICWLVLAPAKELDTQSFHALTKNQQYKEAELLLRSHLRQSKGDPQANYLLAQLMLEQSATESGKNLDIRSSEALERILACESTSGIEKVAPRAVLAYYRGKALYQLKRWEQAENAWLEALHRDIRVPEASWSLLDLYYIENRRTEARDLVLRLIPTETDPRERAQLALELVRQDAIHPDSTSLVKVFEPVLAQEPNAVSIRLALGLARVRSSQIESGLAELEQLVRDHPDKPQAWDGWLEALDLSGNPELFRQTFDKVPRVIQDMPLFARHKGRAFEIDQNWAAASNAYDQAVNLDPIDFGLYVRRARARKLAQPDLSPELETQITRWREAAAQLVDLYDVANNTRTLGIQPHIELCEQLAASRESMNRPDESKIWRTLGAGIRRPNLPNP